MYKSKRVMPVVKWVGVHKALNLIADEDGNYSEPAFLDADLILVDEVSMLDIYLAKYLLDAVTLGSQLVLIGDADQLPSVPALLSL